MKEIFAAFGSEVFRPLVTLLLPGAVAVAPWCVGIFQRWPVVYSMANSNHTETAFVLVAVMLFVGLVLEDIGSNLETRLFDLAADKLTGGSHQKNWYLYLRTVLKDEPVGCHYLRTILLRMKFELGSSVALAVAGPGAFSTLLPWETAFVACVSLMAAGALLFREGKKSHLVLSRVRQELLRGTLAAELKHESQQN